MELGYLFSHSNKDARKVREIRDQLEREGHKPLLFYLKCLEHDNARLPQLISDEIKSRTWFVLCDSDNARSSEWVQEEVRLVKAIEGRAKSFVTIDLERDLEAQLWKLTELSKRATVFLSYAYKDREVAEAIYRELAKQDYRVFFDAVSISSGDRWESTIKAAIGEAVERGFVFLLLSPDYLRSDDCAQERSQAFQILGSRPLNNIVPIIVKDRALVLRQLPDDLETLKGVDLTEGPVGSPMDDAAETARMLEKLRELLVDLKTRPIA